MNEESKSSESGNGAPEPPSALDVIAPSQFVRDAPASGDFPELPEGAEAFDWETMNAFQGQKVLERKRKMNQPPLPLPERIRKVVSNVFAQGPGTIALVGFFIFLTFFDVFFNVSRGFVCAFPGWCDPATGG